MKDPKKPTIPRIVKEILARETICPSNGPQHRATASTVAGGSLFPFRVPRSWKGCAKRAGIPLAEYVERRLAGFRWVNDGHGHRRWVKDTGQRLELEDHEDHEVQDTSLVDSE